MIDRSSTKITLDSIEKLEDIFQNNEIELSIYELQGILTALVCRGLNKNHFDQWQQLLGKQLSSRSALDNIFSLMTSIQHTLESTDFRYQPALGSSRTLFDRTESLRHWCQGFIIGFDWNNIEDTEKTEETGIILSDIIQISTAEVGSGIGEEEERAFFELEEYIKVGVQIIFEEQIQKK
tara:strand:- start:72 stop:611 length:540 start_codon:yes stop_codon:yes gene_type:complete